jgi:hypothetical protein
MVSAMSIMPCDYCFYPYLQGIDTEYSLFMLLGNEKFPHVRGIAHVNLFMNQFPFGECFVDAL